MLRLPIILTLSLFCSTFLCAQQRFSFDFGSSSLSRGTYGAVNNVARSFNAGTIDEVRLLNSDGVQTDIILKVTDDFRSVNTSGTSNPDSSLSYQSSQSSDSFFGNTQPFLNSTNPTAAFVLKGLSPSKHYSFEIFASRMGVTDNRETSYLISGQSSQTVYLNPSNNTDQTIELLNVQPDAQGEINIQLTAGPNNTSSSGFFYINAMELIEHDTTLSSVFITNRLELLYPKQLATWESGKTIEFKWRSSGIATVDIEATQDNGASWFTVSTVPAVTGRFTYTVPPSTGIYQFRISGNGLSEQSNDIRIIPDDGVFYDIFILGSSTAAGTGPSHEINTWVNKYERYLYELDTRYRVENLAVGGQVTYNLLPSGSTIPTGVNETINNNGNISAAINSTADGVIINLPSNDAARSYSVNDQLANYAIIMAEASSYWIPLWQTTPQPRDFGNNASKLSIQQGMLAATWQQYPSTTVDFWSGLPVPGDNGLLDEFDSGDGVHVNNAAHQLFFERMVQSGIHTDIKNRVDNLLITDHSEITELSIHPNPVYHTLQINGLSGLETFEIIDLQGRVVSTGTTSGFIDVQWLNTGCYILVISGKQYRVIRG
ncbi:GDSL-type esterase/lipase family protein [Nonlabens sp. SY33080]|uniref:GDSL-type esterase/lipase family protein n=1 Tax=Nonlabens sp. SY33080 TaxID=2719911 RepID=UPI001428D26D|nr:GDSL-type esterase/lipase family protein [Nonlabens sp. SY33080]